MDDDQQKVYSRAHHYHHHHHYHHSHALHSLFYLQHDLRILFPSAMDSSRNWPVRASRKVNTLVDRISGRLLPAES